MTPVALHSWSALADCTPTYALVAGVDLVLIRSKDVVSVLYGRCLHRGALLADGYIDEQSLICPLHHWDYRIDSGVSEYNNKEALQKFNAWVEEDQVWVDADEIAAWATQHPQPYQRDAYLGLFADSHGAAEEPYTSEIQKLAKLGPEKVGHGPMAAMGVPRSALPNWDDLQILTAQLARFPLLEDVPVASEVIIGPRADKPLRLEIPLLISDMSFGALSKPAKIALARGAEQAGTGICSGEGGMLPEEQESNARYFYELASARFGFSWEAVAKAQAFHFKGGQAAKTGTGGHLPGSKVTSEIAQVRGLQPGEDAISPATFPEWQDLSAVRDFATEVRVRTGGIPIGYKLSAQHIERDLDAAFEVGVDYIILDGRGGGTGAAPTLFRDHISVPTIPALARARRHLDRSGQADVTLIITGGLRTPADFVKALALGADAVALANAAMQAIGCIAMRACHTNACPVGIATQNESLTRRLQVDVSAHRLRNFLLASNQLMQTMARACGHQRLADFSRDDLSTFKREMAELCGVSFAGLA
jgi:glutamate synthase domain-containing protein 2